jgi:hypothetical protein
MTGCSPENEVPQVALEILRVNLQVFLPLSHSRQRNLAILDKAQQLSK